MSSDLTESSTSAGRKTNVLVVEDEMVLRMRAVDIVEDAGFTAIQAVNADEALSILETRSDVSLLFSDIQMPGSMDGLKLAHAVHDRWPSIKIILVSGQVKVSDMDKPAESRFFGKPLESDQMVAELQKMVGAGALKIIPDASLPALRFASPSAAKESLTAEVDSLRLLLEQAGVDAKALLAQAGLDAKEREAANNLQRLIVDELHHRIKNTLATVSAIASQSLRTASNTKQAQQAIDSRLGALGRAHDLLMRVSWANASLVNTVRSAIEPFDAKSAGRISIEGPDIGITSGAVIALAMTFNELCTNTTKFGALSVPAGTVEIRWVVDEAAQRVCLTWTEKGGPTVAAPTRQSFGTRMIGSLGQQLNGEVQLAYLSTGFIYLLDVPLASLTAKG
jgi:two-component sensor histidine kinase/DNA-binding NarL/FixJ family response regulator